MNYMSWKEFLKPTSKKITWTVCIGVVTIFILLLPHGISSGFDTTDFVSILLSPPLGILFNYNVFYALLNGVVPKDSWNYTLLNGNIPNDLFLLGLCLSIFYWYLLSCLIVWIYDKFRNSKKK